MVVATIVLYRGQRAQGPATARRPRRAAPRPRPARCARARAAGRPRPRGRPRSAPRRGGQLARVVGRGEPGRVADQLGQAAHRRRDDRDARGHRLRRGERHDLRAARRHDRQRARGRAAPPARPPRPGRRSGRRRRRARGRASASGPSPATTSGTPARAHASTATSTPFSGASREATSACCPGRRGRALGERPLHLRHDVDRARRRAARRAPGGARARTRWARRARPRCATRRRCHARQRGRVHGRLRGARRGRRAARPGACRARGSGCSRPVRVEAGPDRADEAVVVQVQDDARARGARRRQRAPAERRVDVVRVDDARAGAPHGRRDLVRVQPAAQHPRRRASAAERGGVALEQLDVLAQVLAHEPREVLDHALLAAGRAVAVVQDEDHGARRG